RPRPAPSGLRATDRVAYRATRAARVLVLSALEERLDEVHRRREDDRGGAAARDLEHRLQIAELECDRVVLDHERRILQLLRRLELALGVDDLRAPLALGLSLPCHRTLHAARDLDVLHLDDRDLDPPGPGR